MKSPNNEGDRVPTGHLLSPNEASSTRIGLYLIELLAKEGPMRPLNNPCFCKGNRLLSMK